MSVSSINMAALLADQAGRGDGAPTGGVLFLLRDSNFAPLDLKGGMGFLGKPMQGGILSIIAGAGVVHRGANQKLMAAISRMHEEFSKMNQSGHQILSQMAAEARVSGGDIQGLPVDTAFRMRHGQIR